MWSVHEIGLVHHRESFWEWIEKPSNEHWQGPRGFTSPSPRKSAHYNSLPREPLLKVHYGRRLPKGGFGPSPDPYSPTFGEVAFSEIHMQDLG